MAHLDHKDTQDLVARALHLAQQLDIRARQAQLTPTHASPPVASQQHSASRDSPASGSPGPKQGALLSPPSHGRGSMAGQDDAAAAAATPTTSTPQPAAVVLAPAPTVPPLRTPTSLLRGQGLPSGGPRSTASAPPPQDSTSGAQRHVNPATTAQPPPASAPGVDGDDGSEAVRPLPAQLSKQVKASPLLRLAHGNLKLKAQVAQLSTRLRTQDARAQERCAGARL